MSTTTSIIIRRVLTATSVRSVAAFAAVMAAVGVAAAPAQAQAPDFKGGGCAGWFHPVRKVDNILEWGVENHCTGTGWHPHHLAVTLQKEHTGIFFSDVTERESASHQLGSPDISLHFNIDQCEHATSSTYRMKVRVTAGSHKAEFLDTHEYTVPCDF